MMKYLPGLSRVKSKRSDTYLDLFRPFLDDVAFIFSTSSLRWYMYLCIYRTTLCSDTYSDGYPDVIHALSSSTRVVKTPGITHAQLLDTLVCIAGTHIHYAIKIQFFTFFCSFLHFFFNCVRINRLLPKKLVRSGRRHCMYSSSTRMKRDTSPAASSNIFVFTEEDKVLRRGRAFALRLLPYLPKMVVGGVCW